MSELTELIWKIKPESTTENNDGLLWTSDVIEVIEKYEGNRLGKLAELKIAEEKEMNRHNKNIIHYGVCRECGNIDLLNDECKYYKKIPR